MKRLAALVFVLVPALAWALVKPVRVLAPTFAGVSCPSAGICIDDASRLPEAIRLHSEALAFVSGSMGPIQSPQKVVFCASQACAQSFGLGARSAVTLGTSGAVIGPRAWQPHYVRHEMIHHLQAERLGVLGLWFKPSWFVEGMAYGLSQDPRSPLNEPFEAYRSRFESWYGSIDKRAVWQEADRL